MLAEEHVLLGQLSQLLSKYRSKGLKYKDIKSIVDLIVVHFDDFDSFSDEFVVGLFTSLLDVCTLSVNDKRSSVKLGEQAGILLTNVEPSHIIWNIFQKCGIGILALLEIFNGIDKSVAVNDCALHIEEDCANIAIPVQSIRQIFSLQIFYFSMFEKFVTLSNHKDSSEIGSNLQKVPLVGILNNLITLEAPMLCFQQVVGVTAHDVVVDNITEWDQVSLVSGLLDYLQAMLQKLLGSSSHSSLSCTSTRSVSDFCLSAYTTLSKFAARTIFPHITLGGLLLGITEALQQIGQNFLTIQVWVDCEEKCTHTGFVKESIKQIAYFFLKSFDDYLCCIIKNVEDAEAAVAIFNSVLPNGILRLLLNCCIDSITQDLVTCCFSTLLIGTIHPSQIFEYPCRFSSSTCPCDARMMKDGLTYVEWCLQLCDDSVFSIQHEFGSRTWFEFQMIALEIIQKDSSKSIITIKSMDYALHLIKVIITSEITAELFSSISQLLLRPYNGTVSHIEPSLTNTIVARIFSLYSRAISTEFVQASHMVHDVQNLEIEKPKRIDSNLQSESQPVSLVESLQLILFSLNRLSWVDVIVRGHLTESVATVIQTHYERLPALCGSTPLKNLSLSGLLTYANDLDLYQSIHSQHHKFLMDIVAEKQWSFVWANILINFTFVVKDADRPSVKMIHMTAAQLLEADAPRKLELIGLVLIHLTRRLPRIHIADLSREEIRNAAKHYHKELKRPLGIYLCNATDVISFIRCNIVDIPCGKSVVDILCKHHKIPSLFAIEQCSLDPYSNCNLLHTHFQYLSVLMELLIKYRWFMLLSNNCYQLLLWRHATTLLRGLDADSMVVLNADVSRHPLGVTFLALLCRNIKWWQCCKHVDDMKCEGEAGDDSGRDVSIEVVGIVKDIWHYANACMKEFLKVVKQFHPARILTFFPHLCDLLVQLRVWAVVEKCCCWPVGSKVAGDFPWQVANEIDSMCMSLISVELPLSFTSVTSRLSCLWTVGLLDASMYLQITEVGGDHDLQSNPASLFPSLSSSFLLSTETVLQTANNELLKYHAQYGDDKGKSNVYGMLELKLWVLVPCFTKVIQLVGVAMPEVAVWATSVLFSTFHRKIDWVYHLYFENFVVLAQDFTLMCLLSAQRQLSAELVVPILLTNTELWEVVSKVFQSEHELETFLDIFFLNVLQRVLLDQDYDMYQALKMHKARSSKSANLLNSRSALQCSDGGDVCVSGGTNTLNSTLDKDPMSVYRLLMHQLALPGMDEFALVNGKLLGFLQQLAVALKKHLDHDIFLDDSTSQKVLLIITWQLGSGAASTEEALRVFCTLFLAKRWTWNPKHETVNTTNSRKRCDSKELKSSAFPSSTYGDNVAEVFSRLFVYIFHKIVQREWLQKSQRTKIYSLKVLQNVIYHLRAADLGKFLPKIMFAIESSLSHPSPQVKLAGARLASDVATRLPSVVLLESVSLVIVGLYPLLEIDMEIPLKERGLADTDIAYLQHLALNDLCRHDFETGGNGCSIDNIEKIFKIEKLDLFVPVCEPEVVGISTDDICSIFPSHVRDSAEWHQRQAQMVSVRTLNRIFVEMGSEPQQALMLLPFIPQLPALQEVRRLHESQLQGLTYEENIHRLCDMLEVDSAQLRSLALRQLFDQLIRHHAELYADLLIASSSGRGVINKDCCLQHILSSLFVLASRENDMKVRELVGKCLGEIGAIDPARVAFQPNGSGISDKGCHLYDNSWVQVHLHPRAITLWKFGMTLLEHHLVPELRGDIENVYAQDRTCFAIQTILRVLALTIPEFAKDCRVMGIALGEAQDEFHCSVVGGVSSNTRMKVAGSGITPPLPLMPCKLRNELKEKQVLDTVMPYWTTNYHFKDVLRQLSCPIFHRNLPFERWLGLWCRHLSHRITGGIYAPLFKACRGEFVYLTALLHFRLYALSFYHEGTLRTRAELSQFILPYVILECLVHSDSPSDVLREIKSEIFCVLSIFEPDQEVEGLRTLTTTSRSSCQQNISGCLKADTSQLRKESFLERVARSEFSADDSCSVDCRMAIQSIFRLLDTLHAWVVNAAQDEYTRYEAKGAFLPYNDDWPSLSGKITALLEMVPQLLLARAAIGVDAHARALQYLEQHAREMQRAELQSANPTPTCTSSAVQQHFTLLQDINNDLPPLSSELADYLMECYARLGDSDSLQGVVKLRRRCEVKPSYFSRVCLLEHTDKHAEALQEYDSYRQSFIHSENVGSALQRSYTERGRVRCLKQMGQLHAILDHVFGYNVDVQCKSQQSLDCAVLPTAIEAAWELQRWPTAASLLRRLERASNICAISGGKLERSKSTTFTPAVHRDDTFRVSLAYVMSNLNDGNSAEFEGALQDSRLQAMSNLQGLSCSNEAYERVYCSLLQLHILREAEEGFLQLHRKGARCDGGVVAERVFTREKVLGGTMHRWNDRLELLSPSLRHREEVLALRRSFFILCGFHEEVASNYFTLSEMRRKKGDIHGARAALRYAEMSGLNSEDVFIQECTLVKDSGNVSGAIALLEPLELDASLSRNQFRKSEASMQLLASSEIRTERQQLALRLFLTAQWLSLSHVKHGRAIIDRYKLALDLHKDWEAANFELAKYYEVVAEKRKDELGKKGTTNVAAVKQWQALVGDDIFLTNSVYAMESYIRTVRNGYDHVLQALPKLLTIWFAMASLPDLTAPNSSGNIKNHLGKVLSHISGRILQAQKEIPASTWYLALPQLVSRISHPHQDTSKQICDIVIKVLTNFPRQGIWHMSSLIHSLHCDKRDIARSILHAASKSLGDASDIPANIGACHMLKQSELFFRELVQLAQLQPKDRKIRMPSGLKGNFSDFLVPTQAALTICYPPPSSSPYAQSSSSHTLDRDYFPSDQAFISHFHQTVEVMPTKAKPKKISLTTTAGFQLKFLVKQEKDGDLRKDERMMQFNGVVNRLLQDDAEGRKRQLRLRTFSVICLNEECGVLEWVSDTDGLRHLVIKSHAYWPNSSPPPDFHAIRREFEPVQTRLGTDILRLANWYSQHILSKIKPCFHRWFLEAFPDPSKWLAARNSFTRSCAVWSAVGHIVGLGDRHGENVLIDTTCGECVHVDFDCIFDKGLTLNKPELTPFRLTPNMVDAMGLCGIEGGFRGSMEVSLRLLRDHKDILMSVLEPFIRDPTVTWNRSPAKGSNTGRVTGRVKTTASGEMAYEDAMRMLKTISERLDGIYNLKHPHAAVIIQGCKKRKTPVPTVGLGAQDEVLPLSVIGQTGRLIDEATAINNLSQMYIGWMPWM